MNKTRTAVVAACIASLLSASTAGATDAAESVSITAPSRVVVDQAYELLPWRLSGVDFDDSRDSWEMCSLALEHRATRKTLEYDLEDEHTQGNLRIDELSLKYSAPPGLYDLVVSCIEAGDASTSLVIKWGSRTKVKSVRRNGKKSQVRGRVLRYEGDWTGWKGARVTLQRSTRKGWRKVKTVRAGKKGAVAVNAKLPRKAMIRLVTREGKTTFGSTSTGRR